MIKYYSLLIASCVLLAFTACNTMDSVSPGKGKKFTVTDRSYDQVWKASVTVVSRQLAIVEESKSTGTIKSESKAGFATYGEVVGVFITPAGVSSPSYEIEVVSFKRNKIQITGQDWTATLIAAIKAELQ
jgi:hypothetical protein